jgi:hypothetical protein
MRECATGHCQCESIIRESVPLAVASVKLDDRLLSGQPNTMAFPERHLPNSCPRIASTACWQACEEIGHENFWKYSFPNCSYEHAVHAPMTAAEPTSGKGKVRAGASTSDHPPKSTGPSQCTHHRGTVHRGRYCRGV